MRTSRVALVATLLGAGGFGIAFDASAINKCTGADGGTTYQEAPCPNNSSSAVVKVPTAPVDTLESRFNAAIAVGKIMVGMSAQQVRRAWGEPTAINTSLRSSGRSEQWIYRLGGARADYVYLDSGIVSSIQISD